MQNRFFITIFAISLFLTINAFAQREATDSADTKAKCLTICDFEDLISDSDGDGVIDKLDREHDTPKGCRVDTNGIALDSDSDGIKDCVDREPFTPPGYPVDADGVGSIIICGKDTPTGATYYTPPPIYFAENSDELSPEAQVALRLVSTVLAQNSKQCLMISAYASDSESKNETHKNQLCYNRAKAVIDFLITQYHVMPARLCLKIKGNDNIVKISKNKKEADRFNCRVEITTAACGYESDKKPLK